MSGKCFIDSNILIYTFSKTEPEKSMVAREQLGLIKGVISTQVVQEVYNTLVKKYQIDISSAEMVIHSFRHYSIVTNSMKQIESAIHIQKRYQLSFWDSLIISAAASARCKVLLSEDLNHDQIIEGVKIVNPFL